MAQGQCIEAQGYFKKSIEIFGEYIEGWDIARSLTYLAEATMALGDLNEARPMYLDALRLAMNINAAPIGMDSLLRLTATSHHPSVMAFLSKLLAGIYFRRHVSSSWNWTSKGFWASSMFCL